MLLSIQTKTAQRYFGIKKAVDCLAEAGYDAIDFSFLGEEATELLQSDDNVGFFKELREHAKEKGLIFNQSHAPFGSSFADAEKTEKRFAEIVRAMKYAAVLGAKVIVVHPCQHLTYEDEGVPERLFEINMDFYRRLKPYCEEYGIRVALENMWQSLGMNKISHSTCSRPEEFIKYLDTLDSEWFTACLDIGHANLCCEDPADFIRALGKKRLGALHVHDVDGTRDLHTLPYFGMGNWDKITKALADIDYRGDFTFESGNFDAEKPKELYVCYERLAVETGRFLINKIEKYKGAKKS